MASAGFAVSADKFTCPPLVSIRDVLRLWRQGRGLRAKREIREFPAFAMRTARSLVETSSEFNGRQWSASGGSREGGWSRRSRRGRWRSRREDEAGKGCRPLRRRLTSNYGGCLGHAFISSSPKCTIGKVNLLCGERHCRRRSHIVDAANRAKYHTNQLS